MKPSWRCIGPQGRLQGVSQQSLHRPTPKATAVSKIMSILNLTKTATLMGLMAEHG